MIFIKQYKGEDIPFNRKEAMRYFGYGKGKGMPPQEVEEMFMKCLTEATHACDYRICYSEFTVKAEGEIIDLGFTKTSSKALIKNLDGCERAIAFAATVGLGIDRLIARNEKLSPGKAYAFQAIGAERVESLCNVFNQEIAAYYQEKGYHARPRFSCGYGDFPLEKQLDFMSALDCNRKIGVTLNDSLLMSPSKSVTAIIGLGKSKCTGEHEKCLACDRAMCEYREI